MIYVSCQFETPIERSDYSDYVRKLHLDITATTENGDHVLIGRIAADQVLIRDARRDQMSLFEVCDADSQGLYETYCALFDDMGEFLDELEVRQPVDTMIFMWRSVIHPRLRPFLEGVVATIGSLFGKATVVAMWHDTTRLTDSELASLAFRRIAGSRLIYRHSAARSPFAKMYPTGMDVPVEFYPEESDANWVLAEWKKDR